MQGGCHLSEELNNETNNVDLNETTDEAITESSEEMTFEEDQQDHLQEEMDENNQRILELESMNEELEDRTLRLQAEIANMRRNHTREIQDAAKYRSSSLVNQLVDAIDNLERALDTEVESNDATTLKKGVEMVYQQIINGFNAENIDVVDPIGEEFDPNYHQAVSVVKADEGTADNTVVQVLQKGYKIDQRVIRPAMVIVAQA